MEPDSLSKYFFISLNGRIFWQETGEEAGYVDYQGYRRIFVEGKYYYAHRIVYAFFYGEWPKIVDHINRNVSDNRPENLRSSDKQKNAVNSDKSLGRLKSRGVSKHQGKYRAQIQHKGKHYHVGCFGTEAEAREAYQKRREELNPGIYRIDVV